MSDSKAWDLSNPLTPLTNLLHKQKLLREILSQPGGQELVEQELRRPRPPESVKVRVQLYLPPMFQLNQTTGTLWNAVRDEVGRSIRELLNLPPNLVDVMVKLEQNGNRL